MTGHGFEPDRTPPSSDDDPGRGGVDPASVRGPISPQTHAEIQEIVQEFLEEVARDAQGAVGQWRRRGTKRIRKVFAAFVATACAFVWIVQPTARDPQDRTPPRVVQDASLRFAMVLGRSRVDDFERLYGRLPDTLQLPEGISYRRLQGDGFELHGVSGPMKLVLTSDQDLSDFLGRSFETLERRRLPR